VGIVDDMKDIRRLLRMCFAHDDRYEVIGEAGNGHEAIDLVERTRPDLLILDRQMPKMGGLEALGEIRRRSPSTAVVVYTAQNDAGTSQAALAAGAIDVMTKERISKDFVEELTEVLVGHWSTPDADIEVRVGPVACRAALTWIDNTALILAAVRAHPEVLSEPVPVDVLNTFDGFLASWREVASTSDEFYWVARARPSDVTRITESWAVIDRIPDERLHALGCDWSPPEGQPFFHALTAGVVAAMEVHAETQRLAAVLAQQFSTAYED
jgi:DNA-binding NarL/FixJ family response regulator